MTTDIARLVSHSRSPQSPQTPRSLFGPTHQNEARTRRLVDCGLRWISQQKPADTWQMPDVLAERSDLPPDRAATVESLVTARVSADSTALDVRRVLEPRLAGTDITLAQRAKVIAWSIAWLEHHADGTAGTFAVQGAEELLGPPLSLELDAAQVRRLDAHLRERKALGGRASGEATSARRLREDPAFGYVGG
ncbi:hypothetical protein ACFVIZ_30390 [Streptomyces anulatus]|uniref:hypothetical protein n=1 Tax=Streptomyces anulatus TaxID=1892 RepID=UPI0036290DC8